MRDKGIIDVFILDILNRYSSPAHKLTQNDIIQYLDKEYNLDINRNTLSGYLAELRENGYIEGNRGVYSKRLFSDNEIDILINNIMFSKAIPENDINTIVEKIKTLAAPEMRNRSKSSYFIGNIQHTDNQNVSNVMQQIDKAIRTGRKIEIVSCKYNVSGKLVEKGRRIIDPYYIVMEKDKYYLICYSGRSNDVEARRIDRISNVRILNDARMDINKLEKYKANGFNIAAYMKENIYMYHGESEMITIRIREENIGDFIDWFGKDYIIAGCEGENVIVKIRANVKAVYFWALQYSGMAEILKPKSLRSEIREGVRRMGEMYGVNFGM